MNNKGFMMAEVVVVSAIIIGSIAAFFVGYNGLITLYSDRIDYYDSTTLYELANYRDENLSDLKVSSSPIRKAGAGRSIYYVDGKLLNGKTDDGEVQTPSNNTFKKYIEYLKNTLDLTNKDNENKKILIMEKCSSNDDCKYAYLEPLMVDMTPPKNPVEDEDNKNCPADFLDSRCDYSKIIGVDFVELPIGITGYIGTSVNSTVNWRTTVRIVRYFGWKSFTKPDYVTNLYCAAADGGIAFAEPSWTRITTDCSNIDNIDNYSCYPEETAALLATSCSATFNGTVVQESGTEVTVSAHGFSETFSVKGKTS